MATMNEQPREEDLDEEEESMSEEEFAQSLLEALEVASDEDIVDDTRFVGLSARTFADSGLMTSNEGIVDPDSLEICGCPSPVERKREELLEELRAAVLLGDDEKRRRCLLAAWRGGVSPRETSAIVASGEELRQALRAVCHGMRHASPTPELRRSRICPKLSGGAP